MSIETLPNPLTGEMVNIVDASDTELADLMLIYNNQIRKLDEYMSQIRDHLDERLEESDKNFGGKHIKIEFIRMKDWQVEDNEIQMQVDALNNQSSELKKKAKDLFDSHKIDKGVKKIQMKVTLPKL
jgi:hypothetical protein